MTYLVHFQVDTRSAFTESVIVTSVALFRFRHSEAARFIHLGTVLGIIAKLPNIYIQSIRCQETFNSCGPQLGTVSVIHAHRRVNDIGHRSVTECRTTADGTIRQRPFGFAISIGLHTDIAQSSEKSCQKRVEREVSEQNFGPALSSSSQNLMGLGIVQELLETDFGINRRWSSYSHCCCILIIIGFTHNSMQ